jgi:hypothetical protein
MARQSVKIELRNDFRSIHRYEIKRLTKGLDYSSALVDLKGDAGLMKKHTQGQPCQTGSDYKDLWASSLVFILAVLR